MTTQIKTVFIDNASKKIISTVENIMLEYNVGDIFYMTKAGFFPVLYKVATRDLDHIRINKEDNIIHRTYYLNK